MPQMPKTYPAGVKRFAYKSETSPVVLPPSSVVPAKALTMRVTM